MLKDWIKIHGGESHGSRGSFGIQIHVAGTNLPDIEKDDEDYSMRTVVSEAADMIESALREHALRNDPKAQEEANKTREAILSMFPEPIFVEELPNGYCSKWCRKHLPWFRVTTKIGPIEIGWRKHVMSIDWSKCPVKLKADVLFPDEKVTKGDYDIHAWSYEDARRYLQAIMAAGIKAPKANGKV